MTQATKDWLEKIKQNDKLNAELIERAYALYSEQTEQKPLAFADSPLEQGLQMAEVLLQLNCDSHTLAAAIAYPGLLSENIEKEILLEKLGKHVDKLVHGVERMEALHTLKGQGWKQQHKQIDNLRKMSLAMVDDIRVVLIKLAERVAILRYLKNSPSIQQQQMARQTMLLYAPLANRLGIGQLKWLLEDLSFRYLQPDVYKEISGGLKMRRAEREDFIHKMIDTLKKLFDDAGINNVEISGRAKHIYSIYRKMQRKGVTLDQLYDTTALRVLVDNVEDCYSILSIAHDRWPHIPKEFDDYIAKPKPNGYRSIHTVVIAPEEINVEIQVRTYEMHSEAELGVAAHWQYKEGSSGRNSYEEKISWLREVMDWQKEIGAEDQASENVFSQVFADRVYVFTPAGDVFNLEAGATPLDFAYHIHSDVGNRCKGAKVNDKIVPLTHKLETGDRVEILTAKNHEPSRDWLNPDSGYLATRGARAKVRQWFKKIDYTSNLRDGEAIWEKACKREGLKKSDINNVFQRFNFKSADDLLASLGGGDLGIASVVHYINSLQRPQEETPLKDEVIIKEKTPTKQEKLSIQGAGGLLTQLARCCNPIPGDPILGYITTGRGISIHHRDCQNIQHSLAFRPERVMDISWSEDTPQLYPVDILVEVLDRPGIIRDITGLLANEHITLAGLNTHINKETSTGLINMTVELDSLEPLQKLLNQLKQIDGVLKTQRR